MINQNEQKAQEFLNWIGCKKNLKQSRKALSKNITFDPDLFDDIFQSTIIKVYNAIMNNSEIKDFKNYFYIALKFNYIIVQNKKRQLKNKQCEFDIEKMDIIDETDIEELKRKERTENKLYGLLRKILIQNFGQFETDIYFNYSLNKIKNGTYTYKSVADFFGIEFNKASEIITKIKKFLKESEEIKEIKNQLKLNADY